MGSDLSLIHETRWSRVFATRDGHSQYYQSRFQDGTATITLDELSSLWSGWTESEKIDFCQAIADANIADALGILRFIIRNGTHKTWPAVALRIATELPVQETLSHLSEWCQSCDVGNGANYYQAVAMTGDPQAHDILKRVFVRIWAVVGHVDDPNRKYHIVSNAICCLQYLLGLNENPKEYASIYNTLLADPNLMIRERAHHRLAKYFAIGE